MEGTSPRSTLARWTQEPPSELIQKRNVARPIYLANTSAASCSNN